MEITRIDAESIKIAGSNSYVVYTLKAESQSDTGINIGPKLSNDFSLPGEYEHDENMILIAESREKYLGVGNLFKVKVDEVSVLFVTDDILAVNKQTLDFIGQVEVLFVDKGAPKNVISELIRDLDPRYVIPCESIPSEEFGKLVGQENVVENKKLKLSDKDLVEQEYVTVFSTLV